MSTDSNKQIMAKNIKYYMEKKGVTNQQLCDALGFKYTTFMDWIKGITYPRIGKVEAMANYFGCGKSDLIEEKVEKEPQNEVPVALSAPQGYDNLTDEQKELIHSLIDKYNEKNIGNK